MIRWTISFGEAADRVSILQIKRERICDPDKLANIRSELEQAEPLLFQHAPQTTEFQHLFLKLKDVNAALWEIEENIRAHERSGDFGPTFVGLARSVYLRNDERFRLKRQIDELLGSKILEEKSYSDVESSHASAQSPAPAQD